MSIVVVNILVDTSLHFSDISSFFKPILICGSCGGCWSCWHRARSAFLIWLYREKSCFLPFRKDGLWPVRTVVCLSLCSCAKWAVCWLREFGCFCGFRIVIRDWAGLKWGGFCRISFLRDLGSSIVKFLKIVIIICVWCLRCEQWHWFCWSMLNFLWFCFVVVSKICDFLFGCSCAWKIVLSDGGYHLNHWYFFRN